MALGRLWNVNPSMSQCTAVLFQFTLSYVKCYDCKLAIRKSTTLSHAWQTLFPRMQATNDFKASQQMNVHDVNSAGLCQNANNYRYED